MQDIEREAMDIQLQDKLLSYKKEMGMLGTGTSEASKQIEAGAVIDEEDILDPVLLKDAE
jgi:hypothetical protein